MLESEMFVDDQLKQDLKTEKTIHKVKAVEDSIVYSFSKRAFDIISSVILLTLTSPFILITLLVVFFQDFHNPIFTQTRLTKGGKEFKMFKIRTMRIDAEELKSQLMEQNEVDGPAFKIKDDPRLLGKNGKVGKILRKTSIDELPQLLNIIGGSMSVVGPRPPLYEEVIQYTPYQMQRLTVKSGLTSYWGCSGRSNLSFDEWVRLDVKYINERSFLTDMKIIFLTIKSVATHDGAH